jgi:hypothetical protein
MSVMWISETLPKRSKADQVVLRQHLLGGEPRPVAETGRPVERRGRHGGLNEVTAGDHGFNLRSYSGF